jgi:hypothetical protein
MDPGKLSMSSPVISIPKVVMPSNFYKPGIQKSTINLMPSTSKALSQQAATSNIKSYLSVKKATIDLTSDIGVRRSTRGDSKVRFSLEGEKNGGLSNLPSRASNDMA